MKFSTILPFFAAALAAPTQDTELSLFAKSGDGSVSGYLTSIHEGAGFNYFLVQEKGEPLDIKGENLALADVYISGNKQNDYNVGYLENFLAAGPSVTPGTFTFNSANALQSDKTFWACKNIGDPYNYSERAYVIAFGDKPGDDCVEVALTRVV